MTEPTLVIVDAGLAGGSAAIGLREEVFAGRVVLIGAEAQLPYERPPLSKEYLRGEAPFEDALVRPADSYTDQAIDVHLGTEVTRVDPRARTVELADGRAPSRGQRWRGRRPERACGSLPAG